MRYLLFALSLGMLCLSPCCAYAQDEDEGWAEIENLMNGLTAANQQLLQSGGLSLSNTAGSGLTPGFMEGLAAFSQTYARVLQSIDGAFDVDGAGVQTMPDPFAPNAPNPLWEEFDRWQSRALAPPGLPQRSLPRRQSGLPLPRLPYEQPEDEE